jgi:hypothetical protein
LCRIAIKHILQLIETQQLPIAIGKLLLTKSEDARQLIVDHFNLTDSLYFTWIQLVCHHAVIDNDDNISSDRNTNDFGVIIYLNVDKVSFCLVFS